MSDKETIKTAYMVIKIGPGTEDMTEAQSHMLVQADSGIDAVEKAIQSQWLRKESFAVEKRMFLFNEDDFFSLHKDELHFPTIDDPMGQISVVDKYWKTQEFLSILMVYTVLFSGKIDTDLILDLLGRQNHSFKNVSKREVIEFFGKIRDLKSNLRKEGK